MDSVAIFDGHADWDAPRAQPSGWWAGREAARTPVRFRTRVVAQFRAPQNLAYLRGLLAARVPAGPLRDFALATLRDALLEYSGGGGRALEVLASDPVARRGGLRPAVGLWDEVRRLNRAFYEDRLAVLREHAHLIDRRAPRDGVSEDGEPYHMRMFISDSLRPPGLEHLNTPGPLHALREDQSTWARGPRRERFADAPADGDAFLYGDEDAFLYGDEDVFLYGDEDAPWGRGDPNRTPEQALAEYWGDGRVASDTMTGAPEQTGRAYGEALAWGSAWQENGGTRFMRRESIPFWQQGGREGYDYDIEENLGTASRELDGHVRRWDLDRVRHPRGQEYRRYGPRSGHVV